jgi:endoglucanase
VHGEYGDRLGIITSTPPHLQKDEKKKSVKLEDLFIDLGGNIEGVSVGDYVSFKSNSTDLLNGKFASKSIDNRAGIAVLVELAKRCRDKELAYNVQFLLTAQEEVGCRGAEMSKLDENVESVIVIDVTHGISSEVKEDEGYPLDKIAVGIGPSISREWAEKLKEICGDSCVVEVCARNSGTTAWSFQTKNNGVPTALISIPLRYMHTANEVVNIETCERLVNVLEGVLC